MLPPSSSPLKLYAMREREALGIDRTTGVKPGKFVSRVKGPVDIAGSGARKNCPTCLVFNPLVVSSAAVGKVPSELKFNAEVKMIDAGRSAPS